MAREKAHDEVFCSSCGAAIKIRAEVCPECGVRNDQHSSNGRGRRGRSNTSRSQQSHRSGSHDPSRRTTTVSDTWHYGVGAAVALWSLAVVVPGASTIGAVCVLVGWVLMPVSIYYDRQWVRATTTWNPNKALWLTLSLVPGVNIVGGAVYLYRRFNVEAVSSADGRERGDTEGDTALDRLRERYSEGELSDEEFERKVEQVLATEDRETAEMHVENR
ncbi:SHOCT domain-containing protein [Halobaculum lipolyticum]|uniref:SHOCT domain-containing protein n=1 Tax=Halobaculum lipolyticum TaxID=3032001 RepID=A0ABD5WDL8_9EURY|nr:SHOCT domain-containing protein [Halobaculum sp. DT31]